MDYLIYNILLYIVGNINILLILMKNCKIKFSPKM